MKERKGEQRYQYRAGAFSGVSFIPEGDVELATRDCAVFACLNDSIDTCGKRYIPYIENSTSIFERLFIEGTIPSPIFNPETDTFNSNFYPSTLDVSFLPLEPEDIDYSVKEKDSKTIHSLSLKNSDVELYTFALWGRKYDTDGKVLTSPVNNKVSQDIAKVENNNEYYKGIDGNSEESQEDNDEEMVKNLSIFEDM